MDDRMQALRDPVRLLVAQPLRLVPTDDRCDLKNAYYELRDASGEHLLGTLQATHGSPARAEVAGGSWLFAVERARRGWRIVARTPGSGDPVACYYPGPLPGGRIWVAPDNWGSLRTTHLRYNPSWGLTIDGEEILRVWPTPEDQHDTFDIVVGPCDIELPQLSLLLVPLVCWIAMSEGATLIGCGC